MGSWLLRGSLWGSCVLLAAAGQAQDQAQDQDQDQAQALRQYGTHVHGRGQLDLVLDGQRLVAELRSPGADIVGFEFLPRFEEQTAAVEAAAASLRDAARILGLPAAAGCGSDDVDVRSAMMPDTGHDHDERQGDGAPVIAEHAEFRVTYRLTCASPEKVDHLAPGYFGTFERTRELRVRAVGPWGQWSGTVTRDRPRLDF